jgi:hypothetical protein
MMRILLDCDGIDVNLKCEVLHEFIKVFVCCAIHSTSHRNQEQGPAGHFRNSDGHSRRRELAE